MLSPVANEWSNPRPEWLVVLTCIAVFMFHTSWDNHPIVVSNMCGHHKTHEPPDISIINSWSLPILLVNGARYDRVLGQASSNRVRGAGPTNRPAAGSITHSDRSDFLISALDYFTAVPSPRFARQSCLKQFQSKRTTFARRNSLCQTPSPSTSRSFTCEKNHASKTNAPS